MTTGKRKLARNARVRARAGFTLVELLVVISIIVLLATLLIPTIQTIMTQTYVGKSAAMVRKLHDGALLYKQTTKFYPGQKKDTSAPGGSPWAAMNSRSLTGSQVLAACMFNISYSRIRSEISRDTLDTSKAYMEYRDEYLFKYDVSTGSSSSNWKYNSLSDGFPPGRTMPVLYFLASDSLADKNKPRQFRYLHNQAYMATQEYPTNQTVLESWIKTRAPGTQSTLNDGEFILIAAGLNRSYLLAEVENPNDPDSTIVESDKDDIANDYASRKN